jgi:KaiC/GvpD/RAD55 family RecA-like ATPase
MCRNCRKYVIGTMASQVLESHQERHPHAEVPHNRYKDEVAARTLLDSLLSSKVLHVLIKGEPGCGKTTLAFELMKNFGGGLYVSTRVSQQLSLKQQPIVDELVSQGKLTEINLGQKEGKAPGRLGVSSFKFQDFRLSTSEDIIMAILDGIDKNPNAPLVVLDSWDAIGKRIDPIERQKAEQAMLVMAEARGARILFVSEEPGLTTIDYCVDAVVELSDDLLEGRRIRQIAWKKLRGNAIPQRSFLYTLDRGRFTIFEKTEVLRPGAYPAKPIVPMKHDEYHFSTGSADFDSFLSGGIPRGAFVLLELGMYVNPVCHIPIIQNIQSNFLANNGCVVVLPTANSTPTFSKAKLAPYFPEDLLNSRMRIIHFQAYPEDPTFVKLDADKSPDFARELKSVVEKMKGGAVRSCAHFIGIDTIETYLRPENLKPIISGFGQSMKITGDIMLAVVKQSSSFRNQLAEICDVHLKLAEVDRTLVLYQLNPASELFHVNFDYSAGYPEIKLIPIL